MAPPRTKTPPDDEILRVIDRRVSTGAQPSVRDLAEHFGFAWPAAMHRHLVRLSRRGLVTTDPVMLTEEGRRHAYGAAPVVETTVNVGGPDGREPGNTPPCTVGTVVLPYTGPEARLWLYDELDGVRQRYEAAWGSG